MTQSSIRHISASWSGATFAAAKFEGIVSIWNFATRQIVAEFPTVLDYGGNRLTIDALGTACIAGAYQRKGICCYRTQDGKALWRRSDLGRVQNITILPQQSAAACGFDHRSLEILNLADGKTLQKVRGCRRLDVSPLEPVQLSDKSKPELQRPDGSTIARIKRETFAILSVAFGPGAVAISESGGPVTIFDTKRGERLCRYQPPVGTHALKVGYNSEARMFFAVTWPFQNGGPKKLVSLDHGSGKANRTVSLPASAAEEFCLEGSRLLGSPGWVINTTTGEIEKPFPFPSADGFKERPSPVQKRTL